jgi:hypothetical protein
MNTYKEEKSVGIVREWAFNFYTHHKHIPLTSMVPISKCSVMLKY